MLVFCVSFVWPRVCVTDVSDPSLCVQHNQSPSPASATHTAWPCARLVTQLLAMKSGAGRHDKLHSHRYAHNVVLWVGWWHLLAMRMH